MITFFFRPLIWRKPSASIRPRSPVLNQPSSNVSFVACLVLVVAEHHVAGLSPRSPPRRVIGVMDLRCVTPGRGQSGRVVLEVLDPVQRQDRRGFRQAVSLDEIEPELPEPLGDQRILGRAARDEQADRPAEPLVDLLEDLRWKLFQPDRPASTSVALISGPMRWERIFRSSILL